jgi:hypothetical protein
LRVPQGGPAVFLQVVAIMVVVELPDGARCQYRLIATRMGLRLVRRFASYDLMAMVRDAGWRIHALTSRRDRTLIRRVRRHISPPSGRFAAAGFHEASR